MLRVRRLSEYPDIYKNIVDPICIATYQILPERMQRMRYIPGNLGELKVMLEDRGINLYNDLSLRFTRWLFEEESVVWQFNARFAIIVKMPIVSPNNEQQQGDDLRAFVTSESVGDIAVGLGVAFKDEVSRTGYVKAIGEIETKHESIDATTVTSAEVHLEFERGLATKLAGQSDPDTRNAVLLGAGALGFSSSQLPSS